MENKGLEYERKVKQILIDRALLPPQLAAKLTKSGNDAGFVHQGAHYFLEIKNRTAPDYGSKKIIYDSVRKTWKWNNPDAMSDMFDDIGILNKIANFIPRKYIKFDSELTPIDKNYDLMNFERTVELDGTFGAKLLHKYYAKKDCYYIQVEGKGIFHMAEDRANLNVPRFSPEVTLRLRAKPHSSFPVHNYSFRIIIIGARRSIPSSTHDLEDPNRFPPIK